MSHTVETHLGTLRFLNGSWHWECPTCGDFEKLADSQLDGQVSVNHAVTGCPSGYHETHNWRAAIRSSLARTTPLYKDPKNG